VISKEGDDDHDEYCDDDNYDYEDYDGHLMILMFMTTVIKITVQAPHYQNSTVSWNVNNSLSVYM
jgi:hypothetical protein